MATEAAWLERKESTGRKEKRKTSLTHTGLLMEGVEEPDADSGLIRIQELTHKIALFATIGLGDSPIQNFGIIVSELFTF
jgi:hypothetical protein